jgi:hypothetical protein
MSALQVAVNKTFLMEASEFSSHFSGDIGCEKNRVVDWIDVIPLRGEF